MATFEITWGVFMVNVNDHWPMALQRGAIFWNLICFRDRAALALNWQDNLSNRSASRISQNPLLLYKIESVKSKYFCLETVEVKIVYSIATWVGCTRGQNLLQCSEKVVLRYWRPLLIKHNILHDRYTLYIQLLEFTAVQLSTVLNACKHAEN